MAVHLALLVNMDKVVMFLDECSFFSLSNNEFVPSVTVLCLDSSFGMKIREKNIPWFLEKSQHMV